MSRSPPRRLPRSRSGHASPERINAERALSECATCLETNTCADIAGGACGASCSAFGSVIDSGVSVDPNKRLSDLTQAEAEALCTYSLDQAGGPGASETCSGNVTVTVSTVAECTSALLGFTCTLTVGQFHDCYDAVNSPCDPLTTPACEAVFNCAR
ncbi:MAG: hypothetical protein SFX73_00625 [Kofleriaceae bacterium]|nr:hypothetical protein [Kofleriaceae bacterium]